MIIFRQFIILMLIVGLSACGKDVTKADVRTIESDISIEVFRARLVAAIADKGLQVIEGACGKCSTKTISVPEKDTEIITVYGPKLTLRMMQAGAAVGGGAPLRFYLTRLENNQTRLTYHMPSHALEIFNAPDLKPLGEELDGVFAAIVEAVE